MKANWYSLNIEKEFPEAPLNADTVDSNRGSPRWREAFKIQQTWIEANKQAVCTRMYEIENKR